MTQVNRALTVALALVAVGAVALPGTAQGLTLNGAGATFPFPLYSKWSQVYAAEKGVQINYQSSGSGGGTEWKTKVGEGTSVNWPTGLGGRGNEGVAGLVRQTPNSLGYVELAYALTNKMTFGGVQNRAGQFVRATLSSTTKAMEWALKNIPEDYRAFFINPEGRDVYPVAGFTWILIQGDQFDPAKGKALVEFLWWATHEGQKYAPVLP